MTSREQILADSTSLLKDDPAVAEAIVDALHPIGTSAEKKLAALASLIRKQIPPLNNPPRDPLGHLERL